MRGQKPVVERAGTICPAPRHVCHTTACCSACCSACKCEHLPLGRACCATPLHAAVHRWCKHALCRSGPNAHGQSCPSPACCGAGAPPDGPLRPPAAAARRPPASAAPPSAEPGAPARQTALPTCSHMWLRAWHTVSCHQKCRGRTRASRLLQPCPCAKRQETPAGCSTSCLYRLCPMCCPDAHAFEPSLPHRLPEAHQAGSLTATSPGATSPEGPAVSSPVGPSATESLVRRTLWDTRGMPSELCTAARGCAPPAPAAVPE